MVNLLVQIYSVLLLFSVFSILPIQSQFIEYSDYPSEKHTLSLSIENLERGGGTLMVAVFDKPEEFPMGKRFDEAVFSLEKGSAFTAEILLPKGRYALAVFQDRNGNKKLNKNLMGYPTEPYGFSTNGGVSGFGVPDWQDVVFELKREESLTIFLK